MESEVVRYLEYELHQVEFLLNAVYDQLPSPVNLARCSIAEDDKCSKCMEKCTLKHILTAYGKRLGMFTWRHNQVPWRLSVIRSEVVKKAEEDKHHEPGA